MGYEDAKRRILEALVQGAVKHEKRNQETEKNWLFARKVSLTRAYEIVAATRGQQAQSSPHHWDSEVEVWVFQPSDWYIKFYFSGETCWFVSFHKSGGKVP
jgi:hypothetical protein